MPAAMAADDFLDHARERERLAERRRLALFHDGGSNATRGRFFAKLAKKPRQFFFTVGIDDLTRSLFGAGIHPHVEWAVAHETEPAFRVLQLAR